MPDILTNIDDNQQQPVPDSSTITKSTIGGFNNSVTAPGEPFELISDVALGSGTETVGSVSAASYSIEYSALGGRGEIRNLLADTFQINNNNNDQPSPGPSFPVPEEVNSNEFFSTDIRPVIASDVTQERSDVGIGTTDLDYGSTIDTYTSILSRPDLWRQTDGGMFEVAGINDLKHYSFLPPQETRMIEDNWPGTQVGIATGIISGSDPTKIANVIITFDARPTSCNGVAAGNYTIVYEGDLVHDNDKAATATNGYLQRNTRIKIKDGTTYTLNKSHTYTDTVGIAHTFKVRRIGPSKIIREYGYYGYHYYLDEGSSPSTPEDYKLTKEYTSEYSYAYYYGKKPDGSSKTGSSALGAAGVDGNTDRYSSYNTTGRWGVYIDAEVKNYFEGRTFIGHNQGIGVGTATATINGNANTKVQPDPILSVFNNRFKNQLGELDIGSTNCPGTPVGVHGDYNFDQYQMGLYVEDIAAIGTRPDIRYRLSVDGTTTGAGILGKFTGITSTRAAYFKGDVDVVGVVSANSFIGTISGSSVSGDISGNAASASGLTGSPSIVVSAVRSTNLAGVGNRAVYSDANGNLTNSSSDKRFKENVIDLSYGLDTVCNLNPVSFNWIDKEKFGSQTEIGLIAQEVQNHIPEVIGVSSDETLTLDYAKLTPVLIKAVQELKAENDFLKSQIESIKKYVEISS